MLRKSFLLFLLAALAAGSVFAQAESAPAEGSQTDDTYAESPPPGDSQTKSIQEEYTPAENAEKGAPKWYKSFAKGIDQRFLANVGADLFGMGAGETVVIPPIWAVVDYKLSISLPITIGAMAAFGTSKKSETITPPQEEGAEEVPGEPIEYAYTDTRVGGRAAWHFGFEQNMDVFAGISLLYHSRSTEFSGSGYNSLDDGEKKAKADENNLSEFGVWIMIGARYFFTEHIGAALELHLNIYNNTNGFGSAGTYISNIGLAFKF